MSAILANVTRGEVVESSHRGNIVVADSSGTILAHMGNPEMVTFMRSAAKPLQALNVIRSDAYKKFQFTNEELAIFCASHYGERFHQEVIHKILQKMGDNLDSLLCGTPYSISTDYHEQQVREHHIMTTANSDCSGKHCGFLSVCHTKGYDGSMYDQLLHPMQQEILQILSDFCDMECEEFPIGMDGCGVPVHGMPLRNMAMAYARFANPEYAPIPYQEGCKILFDAMNQAPHMIAGTNGFCTEFLQSTNGKFCGKSGAEAIYCIGVKNHDLGIVVKMEDGSDRALYPVVLSTLQQLGLLTIEEMHKLNRFTYKKIYNNRGEEVGSVCPVFQLIR